jgi:hypothetical protein
VPGRGRYVPIGHAGERNLPATRVLEALVPILQDPGIRKVGQRSATRSSPEAGTSWQAWRRTRCSPRPILTPGGARTDDILALENLATAISHNEVTRPDGRQIPFPDVDMEAAARTPGAPTLRSLADLFLPQLEARGLTHLTAPSSSR